MRKDFAWTQHLGAALLGWLALQAGPAVSQDLAGIEVVLEEDIDPIWSVSGHIVVGAMTVSTQADGPYLSLNTRATRQEAGQGRTFCVDLMSRSRSYLAHGVITVPPGVALPLSLPLTDYSSHPEEMRSFASDDLAIRAQDGDCRKGGSIGALVVAGWGDAQPQAQGGQVRVLLNARTSEALVRLTADGAEVDRQRCDKVADAQLAGYDFVCTLTIGEDVSGTLDGTVLRSDFGQMREPARFQLLLGE